MIEHCAERIRTAELMPHVVSFAAWVRKQIKEEPMPITDFQLEQRRKHIGSSDMACILGVSPWGTASDVWLDKTGKLEEREPESWMNDGTFLEEGILLFAQSKLGKIERNQYRSLPEAYLGANIDAIAMERGEEPIESKKVEFTNPSFEAWGEAGSDQVPDEVIIQTHVHMLCQSKTHPVERCHVAGLIAGRLGMYEVPFNRQLADTICEHAIAFWENHVVKDIPPEGKPPSLETLRRVRREPGKVVVVAPKLVIAFQEAQQATKVYQAAEDDAKAALIAALGDADGGDAGEAGLVTYLSQSRNFIDQGRLKDERPEIAAEYTKQSTFPVLRVKKPTAKKGSK